VIQIPCYNEEESLPGTLAEIPREVTGFEEVRMLVIDDGSTDGTVRVAGDGGADRVLVLAGHQGLAKAFRAGLDASLDMGADVIVNIDADGQYDPACIGDLVEPIVRKQADIVIGDRQTPLLVHFSRIKKLLQRAGSWIVSRASGVRVPDATSGFRAYSRRAALSLNVFSGYTYTLETLIQAGQEGLRTASVPIRARRTDRPSRLMRSMASYVAHSTLTILRTFMLYRAVWLFLGVGALLGAAGVALVARFMYFYFTIEGQTGYVQSLVFGGTLILLGFQFLLLGVLADLISANRRLHEEVVTQLRTITFGSHHPRNPAPSPSARDAGPEKS
jgi:glycosyltransferase involved in cell wall biosynthesis